MDSGLPGGLGQEHQGINPWLNDDLMARYLVVSPALVFSFGRGQALRSFEPRIFRARSLSATSAVDRCFYAIKANPHPEILRTLVGEGFGLECVSQGEFDHVFATLPHITPSRVLFTPSFAPRREYEAAFERGIIVTLDNIEALQRWPEVFRGRTIWLRIDLGHGEGHHEKVRTGGVAAHLIA